MVKDEFEDMPEKFKTELDDDGDGWSDWNPNNAVCEVEVGGCGSHDLEFLWNYGKVVGYHCKQCDDEGFDK